MYKNGTLEFFNHTEGIVEKEADGYKYVYQFKDHLGNIRLSYKDADKNGAISQSEIVQEKNYYPFGMTHSGYNTNLRGRNHNYGFNGQETDESLRLKVSEMTFRQYDPAIGRFMAVDRLTELSYSITPYRFAFNNPVAFSDPTGLFEQGGGNVFADYYDQNGVVYYDPNVHGPDDVPEGASYIGETYINHDTGTFWDENGQATNTLDEVVITTSKSKSYADYYGDLEHNYNGVNDILLGAGFTGVRSGYNNNFKSVNRAYYKTFKKAKQIGVRLPKPGKQRQALKKIFSKSKLSRGSKLLRKAGVIGGALTVGNIAVDVLEDGNIKASSIIDGSMLTGGAIISVVFPPAAIFVGAAILVYGIADYVYEINDTIDQNTEEIKLFDK